MNEIFEFKELINEANNQEFVLNFKLKIKEIHYLCKISILIIFFQLIFYLGHSILSVIVILLFLYITVSLVILASNIENNCNIDIKLVNSYINRVKNFEHLIIITLLWDLIDTALMFVNSDMQMLKNSESIHRVTFYKFSIINSLLKKVLLVSLICLVYLLENLNLRKKSVA